MRRDLPDAADHCGDSRRVGRLLIGANVPCERSALAIEGKQAAALLAARGDDDERAFDERERRESPGWRRCVEIAHEIVPPSLASGCRIRRDQNAVRPDGEHVIAEDGRCSDWPRVRSVVSLVGRTEPQAPGVAAGRGVERDEVVIRPTQFKGERASARKRDLRVAAADGARPQCVDGAGR